MQNNLKKMLLISPEIYSKIREHVNSIENLSFLDNEMLKIIIDKTKNASNKWYDYRQQLVKAGNLMRRSKPKRIQKYEPSKNQVLKDVSVQTKRPPLKKEMAINTSPIKSVLPLSQEEYFTTENDFDENIKNIDDVDGDDEMNIDFDLLTSPTNRLSINTSRKLFEDKTSPKRKMDKFKDYKVITSPGGLSQMTVDIERPKRTLRSTLKRSASNPSQSELNFFPRKHARFQNGNGNWTKL